MVRAGAALLALALVGCSSSGGFSFGRRSTAATTERVTAPAVRTAESLAVYLDTLRDLIEGDAVVQTDAFRSVAAAADSAPTTTNRLRLALALATPAHPASNPKEAERQLRELLATEDALLPEERTLVLIHLNDVEQRLILDAEAGRLERAVAAATAVPRDDRTAERLQTALDENRQLRLALDEARATLDAITNIERSIRERDNGADSQ